MKRNNPRKQVSEWTEINAGSSKRKSWKRPIAEKLQGSALSYSGKNRYCFTKKSDHGLAFTTKAWFSKTFNISQQPLQFFPLKCITGCFSLCHENRTISAAAPWPKFQYTWINWQTKNTIIAPAKHSQSKFALNKHFEEESNLSFRYV